MKSWVAELHDVQPRVRRQAVLKLGNVGDADPTVEAALAEALRDTDVIVRRDAIRAVAKLAKASETIIEQLATMSRNDPDTLAKDYAKRALAHFGKSE